MPSLTERHSQAGMERESESTEGDRHWQERETVEGRERQREGGRDIRERPEDNVQQVLMFKHQAAAGCHRASVTARVTERRSALL